MTKAWAAAALALRFPVEVVLSGWETTRLILRGGRALQPGFARLNYEGLSENGVVALGVLITLTPGTTTVDIDPVRRELLLHVLDSAQAPEILSAIRRGFEPHVRALFGEAA